MASALPLNQSKSEWLLAGSRDGFYSAPASSACHTLTTPDNNTSLSNTRHKPQTHFQTSENDIKSVADYSPAESLWNKFQVVVSGHELGQAGEFADARWDPVKVQFVGVHVQLLQFGQLTDCRLDGDTYTDVRDQNKCKGQRLHSHMWPSLQAAS